MDICVFSPCLAVCFVRILLLVFLIALTYHHIKAEQKLREEEERRKEAEEMKESFVKAAFLATRYIAIYFGIDIPEPVQETFMLTFKYFSK
ncbi:hypothetical protein QQF64_026172 [Cirrhinus molitorella]|uniref:Uncharacterized protein n=1 Tax=Cirrhinus molitorella TaxID=172907 RepID=A0ABR3NRF5_9TELE